MGMKNEKGFIQLIAYLIIFVIFSITVYTCLELFDIIEVPEEYSMKKWLTENFKLSETQEFEIVSKNGNENKRIRIQVDNEEDDGEQIGNSPNVADYISSYETNPNISESTASFLYYDQLDQYGKIIYKEIEKNLDNMKSGTYTVKYGKKFDDLLHEENGEDVLNNSFQLAVNALNFDYPETFYIDVSKLYLFTQITKKLWSTAYSVEIGCKEGENYLNSSFKNENEVNIAIERLRAEKESIKSQLTEEDLEEKIKYVHNYLIDNIEYDSTVSRDNIYNIYGALINKTTVCEGYARAFKYIMDDINVPCIVACGTGINSNNEIENHAWNYVRLDDKWYAIDVTWDDPIIIGNGRVGKNIRYRYYLKGSTEFFANHTEKGDIVGDASFKYPVLSETNY